jgi:AraC-like DNA-binding protein
MPPPPRALRTTPLGDTDPYTPSARRPVRVRARFTPADTHFEPHRHAWAQLAYCSEGLVRVAAVADAAGREVTYIVPPTRAVWIAPDVRHAVTVLEAAEFRTLYIDASAVPPDWTACRVIEVSALLREAVAALDVAAHDPAQTEREALLIRLIQDELSRAGTQALGVPMPDAAGDKRLRSLCEAVMRQPGRRATLAEWAADMGASERTMARLFRDELGTTYQHWRQQVVLAHALPLLTRGQPVGQVAQASGYASESAFTAMFRSAMGRPPRHFQGRATARTDAAAALAAHTL